MLVLAAIRMANGFLFEGLQSWLGGLASLAFCGVGSFCLFCCFLGNIYVSAFACHATGLDAVCVFAEDGELAVTFCSLATGLLGQTALGANKNRNSEICI